jgi:hypothetical protein
MRRRQGQKIVCVMICESCYGCTFKHYFSSSNTRNVVPVHGVHLQNLSKLLGSLLVLIDINKIV